jgi:glycosyltransferase involved in cell wall biosynthesis/GT2 family glycosyltransferase
MRGAHGGLRIGFVEPHLRRFGGVRRMLEFANRLVARGQDVSFYLPDHEELRCSWMRCDAQVKPLSAGIADELDVVLFSDERQWYLVEVFAKARHRVFYALHYAAMYGKAGSWESVRAAVDLQLANSNWTADQIGAETGHRPTVQLGGVDRDVFRPYGGRKRYPVLCTGGDGRPWKGTDTILAAGRMLNLTVERYAEKDLDQPALGREYDASRVFAVGSWFEGFGQPGLEALACGVPLVTTDNGGCREYAAHEETALVVPPRDPEAMANAIGRLLDDRDLSTKLVLNGLDVVACDFDWERRTDEFAEILDGVSAGTALAPPPRRRDPPTDPKLSVVVLAWDNLAYTQRFVESARRFTDVRYELIVVDNGSVREAAKYAAAAADTSILNKENLGFAHGMNQGLAVARGEYVAFCNNDTILPERWAGMLLETAQTQPRAGIVVPALTAARSAVTVRSQPGHVVETLPPFSAPPGAVVYLMRTDLVRRLGAWDEGYEIASGEDLDLAFTVWVNDLDIVYDQRVLVDHVGKGSAVRLQNWGSLWERNRRRFFAKWTGGGLVPRLETCEEARYARNRATARAVAGWMERYFAARDRPRKPTARWRRGFRRRASAARNAFGRRTLRVGRAVWRRARPHLPPGVARRMRGVGKRMQRMLVPTSADPTRERGSRDYRDDGVFDGEATSGR